MKRKGRIYWRVRGGERRAYADFRDFADVGGGREALRPAGAALATNDPAVARVLADRRLAELQALRRQRAVLGEGRASATLGAYASRHLVLKKESARFTDGTIAAAEHYLERAVAYFGASRALMSLTVADVQGWIEHLKRSHPGRGRGKRNLSGGTLRHHINALSNLYERAKSENLVVGSYNPVANILRGEKPTGRRAEARWLEVHETALLLEAARRVDPRRPETCRCLHVLLATMALTGGRKSEVLGLTGDDVSLERKTVTFRPNDWRRLKTATSWRTVPLWAQLEAILGPYLVPVDRTPRTGLLFPTIDRNGRTVPLVDFRKALDTVAVAAGWKAGEITTKMLRHTYCAARIQTLDRGAPVSLYTVAKEMGHGGDALVKRIYGHLGQVRHRAEVVEYRIEQHLPALRERMEGLPWCQPFLTPRDAEVV